MKTRSFHQSLIAALLFSIGLVANATAQSAFPNKPIRLVIGFPAGGPLDQHARLLSEKLQGVLGQQIIVDYKAGAGGIVGAQDVQKAAPDGYTIMLANTGVMVINPGLYSKLPYQTTRDFVPIARTAMQPLALLVNPNVKANTLQEFMAYAKANPGKVNYGSAGNGGISHLVPEMFKSQTGLFMVHIPYRGSAPAFTDLMAGQVQFMAESIPSRPVSQAGQGTSAGRHQQRAQPCPARCAHRERDQSRERRFQCRGLLWLSRPCRHTQTGRRQARRCL